MTESAHRILGQTFDGNPIYEPNTGGSRIVFAAAGGGKTTCVAVPAVLTALPDTARAVIINDVKEAEIAAQIEPVCVKHGRFFGVIDDCGVFPEDYVHRLSCNPFGAAVDAFEQDNPDLTFIIDNIAHALIDEPPGDAKSFYWRESPREKISFGIRTLLNRSTALCTPGTLYCLIGDPETWDRALEIEASEGDPATRILARQLIGMRDNDQNDANHTQAALSALKIYAPGSPLQDAGRNPDLTHRDIITDGWIVCLVNPVRYADRLGAHFALHTLGFMEAQLSGAIAKTDFLLDEATNAPLRDAVKRVTIFRGYKARADYIVQSRQDFVQTYGEKQTAILEENCTIKQYLKFSNYEEAERVSKAMGETLSVNRSIGVSSDKLDISGNLSTGKERLFTPDELMRLPADEQIVHVANVGWIHCKKIRQNQIAPYCFDLGDNPLEGTRLPPDPVVTLVTPDTGGKE